MNVTRLQFVTVPVTDQDRAKDFYVDALGFELVVNRPAPNGGRFVMVAPKGGESGLVLADFPVGGREPAPVHVQLQTSDVDADVAALRESGVPAADPQDMPWGRATSFQDPDGNTFGLLQPSVLGDRPGR